MLEIQDLQFGYAGKPLLDIKSLKVPDRTHLLVRGPSGSGKSSLLSLLAGFVSPEKGKIVVNGTEMTALKGVRRDAFRGRQIGFVFQQPHLVSALTILQNVMLVPFMAGVKGDKAHALKLLKKLGLEGLEDRLPGQLSHGQQQRVGVARALVHKPGLVLADEPTSALDDKACKATLDLLLSTAEDVGAQVIVASHDGRITQAFKTTFELGK